MFIPEELKLNKFKKVRVPKVIDMAARFGYRSMPSSAYAGDDVQKVASDKAEAAYHAQTRIQQEAQEFYESQEKSE